MNSKYLVHFLILLLALSSAFIISNYSEDISRSIIISVFEQSRGSTFEILDTNGVPFINYGYWGDTYIGLQRNPVQISQKSFVYYDQYINGDNSSRQKVINSADWLINNSNYTHNSAFLDVKFYWPLYNMSPPWRSGMAQGQALQTMILAHKLTGDNKYLVWGDLAVNSFDLDIKDGGFTNKTTNDGWWYEEYAGYGGDNPRVLNGMMFATIGLYDYYNYTKNPQAKYYFDKGVIALTRNIANYDNNGDTFYDIHGIIDPEYHQIHIDLSQQLYNITGEKIFMDYSNKWKEYKKPIFIVRLIKNPDKLNLAILIFNIVIIFSIFELAIFLRKYMKK